MKTFFYIGIIFNIVYFCTFNSYAQTQKSYVNIPSANAATLGTFGKIPVSLFTGSPSITIPLYTIQDNTKRVAISLDYHTANVKGNNHPGWTGLGWSLVAGGIINRIVNGEPDERVWAPSEPNAFGQERGVGFYSVYNKLNGDNWATIQAFNNYLSLYNSESTWSETSPDEFSFNFLGYSGEFYLNHEGKWVVNSSIPIKVEFDSNTGFTIGNNNLPASIKDRNPNVTNTRFNPRYFKEFTLITPDGIRYKFGGENAVEYSINYLLQEARSDDYPPIASSFYLKEIKSLDGSVVTFTYTPRSFNSTNTREKNVFNAGIKSSTSYEQHTGTLHMPVYLNTIESANEKIYFYCSESKDELQYRKTWLRENGGQELNYLNRTVDSLKWYKLDSVVVKNIQGNKLKSFRLTYTTSKLERLKLLTVKEVYPNEQSPSDGYLMTYMPVTIKGYGGDSLDHWGYSNGKSNFIPNITEPNSYYTLREVDITGVSQSGEIIKSITYPTKGKSEFFFEPNTYSYLVNRNFSITENIPNTVTGGLRISEIRNFTNSNSSNYFSKRYYYVRGYNNTISQPTTLPSSGILAGLPNYAWNNFIVKSSDNNHTYTYSTFSSGNLYPFVVNANGSHIGYSEVVEVDQNATGQTQGYKVTKFTNFGTDEYGNIHNDEPALLISYYAPYYLPFTEKSIERGLITSERSFDSNGVLKAEESYYYDKLSYNFIRIVDIRSKSIPYSYLNSSYHSEIYVADIPLVIAYKKYMYKYMLIKKLSKMY